MRVFLDFEASSLADDSYPIEVGWVFEDGREEGWLIRPAEGWTDWAALAESVHRISREDLLARGADHTEVARRMVEALSGHDLHASAPSWDGKWMSVLLRAAGLPRHALRLTDTEVACVESVAEILSMDPGDIGLRTLAARLIGEARQAVAHRPVRHRAVEDARGERDLWQDVRRRAEVLRAEG